jgi:hypothetical protein
VTRLSKHRHLDRQPVREQHQRPIAIGRKPVAEFLNNAVSVPSTFATRFNDIGTPPAIF